MVLFGLFNDIKNKRFIRVSIFFGFDKSDIDKGAHEQWFDFFQRMRFEVDKYEKQWRLPKGIFPKTTIDYFPPEISRNQVIYGGEDIKGYVRSKRFVMEISKEGFVLDSKTGSTTKFKKNNVLVSFLPVSKYSPLELAKDAIFLATFGARFVKVNGIVSMRVSQILEKKNQIFIRTIDNVVEYEYPLKDRIKLYKADKELDKFIFHEDFLKMIKGIKKDSKNPKLTPEQKDWYQKVDQMINDL